jgi:hypothetical protein
MRAYRIEATKPIGFRRSFDVKKLVHWISVGPTYQSFGRDYQAGAIETLYMISPDTPQRQRVPVRFPKIALQQHGCLHRRRHRHRGGATHHDRRNGRVVALTPIREVATQQPPMSEKQAIVLILLLSLGLWQQFGGSL